MKQLISALFILAAACAVAPGQKKYRRPQVPQPPSTLTAVMANLEPLVEVTFTIDGVVVGTDFTDANGDILEIVLPVDRQFSAGIHELTGTTDKLDAFLEALDRSAILETVRTGVSGIGRGEWVLKV